MPAIWPIGSIAMALRLPMVSPAMKNTYVCQAKNHQKSVSTGRSRNVTPSITAEKSSCTASAMLAMRRMPTRTT